MATITHHINRLKEQPSHIRERVAFGVSGGVTALVAIGWLVAMSSSGSFTLATKSVAESVRPPDNVATSLSESGSGIKSLLGAAGEAFGASSAPSAIKVVDTNTSPAPESETSATVIPF